MTSLNIHMREHLGETKFEHISTGAIIGTIAFLVLTAIALLYGIYWILEKSKFLMKYLTAD